MPTTLSYLGVPYPHTTYIQHIGGARGRRRVSNVQLQGLDGASPDSTLRTGNGLRGHAPQSNKLEAVEEERSSTTDS